MPRFIIQLFFVFVCLVSPWLYAATEAPKLPLAKVYKEGVDLEGYWLSEKLDGVRAYWDGKQLLSKQGHIYYAPSWFIANFPRHPLDGELWVSRNRFEYLMTIVRDKEPGEGWKDVRYMVFDLPIVDVTFTNRIEQLKRMFSHNDSPYLSLVEQSKVTDHQGLMKRLDEVVAVLGEGLMLHKGSSLYLAGRSHDLLKVKRYQDAEAKVIGHLPGKGKYTGMLGALLLETEEGKRFRIGTGFTDRQRQDPPPIGALISYKYYAKTAKGLPKFASFLRIREP